MVVVVVVYSKSSSSNSSSNSSSSSSSSSSIVVVIIIVVVIVDKVVQWNLRIKDNLGPGILSVVRRLVSLRGQPIFSLKIP